MKFSLWVELKEARSQESSMKCPYPKNKEFCREWNKYVKGERGDPFLDRKFSSLKPTERKLSGRRDTVFRKDDGYDRKQGKSVSND
jgi:hypothetical protein